MPETHQPSDERVLIGRAFLLGPRVELQALGGHARATSTVVRLDDKGLAVVFRFGAVVSFTERQEPVDFTLRQVEPFVTDLLPPAEREVESIQINIKIDNKETVDAGILYLSEPSSERLQLVADVLAKSVSLAHYESKIAAQFDRIAPFAARLDSRGRGTHEASELLQHLGGALIAEHTMVAGVQVDDSPELLWDHPELERLWNRLRDEFEIRERFIVLGRKLDLITRTAETALKLIQNDRALRVEWYIVGLIVLEIVLTLVEWTVLSKN